MNINDKQRRRLTYGIHVNQKDKKTADNAPIFEVIFKSNNKKNETKSSIQH